MNRTTFMAVSTIAASSLLLAAPAHADQTREFAEDLAAAVCAVLAAPAGNSAQADGALACKYTTRAADTQVKRLVDRYFEGRDQEFANSTCTTIVYADGRTIRPAPGSGCR
jgi:hypothetical protein